MNYVERPVTISDKNFSCFGILRFNLDCNILVILLPAQTGTRIGPQRLFVEIARDLAKANIASLCLDLPGNGDSFDNSINHVLTEQEKIGKYVFYLNKVISFLDKNYKFKEYILSSISAGCTHALFYSKLKAFKRIILLSPTHKNFKTSILNKHNARAYLQKLFLRQTWKKLVYFKINFINVGRNLLPLGKRRRKNYIPQQTDFFSKIGILIIFGEKDATIEDCLNYWNEYVEKKKCSSYTQKIIEEADHSFLGWILKKKVCNIINNWLASTEVV